MAISNRDTNAGARAWSNSEDTEGIISSRVDDAGIRAWRNSESSTPSSGGGGDNFFEVNIVEHYNDADGLTYTHNADVDKVYEAWLSGKLIKAITHHVDSGDGSHDTIDMCAWVSFANYGDGESYSSITMITHDTIYHNGWHFVPRLIQLNEGGSVQTDYPS